MKTLQEENLSLKLQLMNVAMQGEQVRDVKPNLRRSVLSEADPPSSPPDMVFDFSGLANESETTYQEKQKTVRRFPLSLTSPLTGRKKSEPTLSKPKATSVSSSSATSVAANTGAQGKQSKANVAIIPPISQNRGQVDARRSTIATSSSTSLSSVSTTAAATSKQPLIAKQTSILRQSPVQLTKQSSYPTNDASSSLSSSSSQLASRSISAPETKTAIVGRGKQLISEHSLDTHLHSLQGPQNQSPTTSSGILGTSLDVDSNIPLANDADSPFLLLEDEYIEHSSAASYCRFSLTGQHVASLDVDGVVKVWMWSPQPATTATVMSRSAFLSLAWASKSDRWLLLGNKAGTIRLFDVKESKTYREVLVNSDNPANCMRVTDLSTSPSSMQFVCATSDLCPFTSDISTVSGRLLQWDLRTLKLERALLVDSTVCTAVTCSSYSQSGHLLLTGGADGSIRIYDSNQQKPVLKWQAHDLPIHTVHFQGDKSVYSMSADGKLHEWSLNRPGQLLNTLSTGARDLGKVNSGSSRGRLFSLDMDNHYLLTYLGRKGAIYKVSGVTNPTCVMELKPHQSPVVTVDWSPSLDTRVCLTSSADGKVKISTLLSK
uniref:WD repeat-containing protein 91 n=1 Tax=Arion vulgaris TaxID=1028688 RepID=A0A0B7AEI3_9EUPU